MTKSPAATATRYVAVSAPRFETASFDIAGDLLVIHRFSAKTKAQMKTRMEVGSAAGNKKIREAKSTDTAFHDARYISSEGWDGFHAGAVRNAMVSACRLCGLTMTKAKMSIFVQADGHDALEPQIPLIRILDAQPVKQEDMARVETGQPYVTVRAAYHNWRAKLRITFDLDQHTLEDISNLLTRVGLQVGLCEGRPDSKKSAGMGWGTFMLQGAQDLKQAA